MDEVDRSVTAVRHSADGLRIALSVHYSWGPFAALGEPVWATTVVRCDRPAGKGNEWRCTERPLEAAAREAGLVAGADALGRYDREFLNALLDAILN